ncbi:MAG: hypothetical protein ACI4MG_11260 [Aristaeellaceae bacterium]
MEGFSFAGVHSGAFGCWHIPDAKERGGGMEDYELSELVPENRDGGYYLGVRAKPRDFELKCYFEEITETQ